MLQDSSETGTFLGVDALFPLQDVPIVAPYSDGKVKIYSCSKQVKSCYSCPQIDRNGFRYMFSGDLLFLLIGGLYKAS